MSYAYFIHIILQCTCHIYTIYILYLVTTDHHPCLGSFKCCDSNRAGRWPLRPAGTETATQSQVLVGVVVKGSAKQEKMALGCWEWWSIALVLLGGLCLIALAWHLDSVGRICSKYCCVWKNVHIDEPISTIRLLSMSHFGHQSWIQPLNFQLPCFAF